MSGSNLFIIAFFYDFDKISVYIFFLPEILKLYQQTDTERYGVFMKTLDYIILVLIIVGAVNWGLVGFFQFDLVRVIFGNMSLFSRIIYAVVGLSGLYAISYFGRIRSTM